MNTDYLKAYVSNLIISKGLLSFDEKELAVDLEVTRQEFEDGEIDDWVALYGCNLDIGLQKKINTHHELRIFDEAELLKVAEFLTQAKTSNDETNTNLVKSKCVVCGYPTVLEVWDFCVVCGWQDGVVDKDGRSASNRDSSGNPMFVNDAVENWIEYSNIRGLPNEGSDDRARLFWKSIFEVIA